MVNKNKNRGDEFERQVVNTMRDNGFTCVRTLERGARMDGTATWDIDLHYRGFENAPLIGECKRKKSGFKFIYDSLDENDFLAIKQDRCKPLYILPERVFLKLIKDSSD